MHKLETQKTKLQNKKIIVLLGAGGVGKTSCSIGLALNAARNGKKVGLLSIDPAKRLAAALNMELSSEPKHIALDPEAKSTGSLEAAMVDQKSIFDTMIKRYAKNKDIAEKILNHKLYIAASTKLSGSIEYMALAKLQEMVEQDRYDLIVLDTPPDSHALNFLARPNILAGFMDRGVMNWLIKPFSLANKLGFNRLLSVGEKLMGGLSKVTGLQALHTLADFLVLIQHVIEGFHSCSQKVSSTLKQSSSSFVLISASNKSSCRSSKLLGEQLSKLGYPLNGLVFNKALSQELKSSLKNTNPQLLLQSRRLNELFDTYREEEELQEQLLEDLRKLNPHCFAIDIPSQKISIQDRKTITEFSKYFSAIF